MSLDRALADAGFGRGGLLALAVAAPVAPAQALGLTGLAWQGGCWAGAVTVEQLALVETRWRPRWTCWSVATLRILVSAASGPPPAGIWRPAHRLLFGGWRADPPLIWAALHDLDEAACQAGQLDLLGASGDEGTDLEQPVRPDGHLRPEWWPEGGSAPPSAGPAGPIRAGRGRPAAATSGRLAGAGEPLATAHSESVAEQMCAELTVDGLPIDRVRAEQLIATFIGPRPCDPEEALSLRRTGDRSRAARTR